jgi:hypothetical protein
MLDAAEFYARSVSKVNEGNAAGQGVLGPAPSGRSSSWFGTEPENVVPYSKGERVWRHGLDRMSSLVAADLAGISSIRRVKTRGDFGDFIDMQRVYAGQLDRAWDTTTRVRATGVGRVVTTVMVNIGGNCHEAPDAFFWRGAAAVRLCDALERSGRSVRIVLFSHIKRLFEGYRDEHTVIGVVFKREGESIDIHSLTVATALSGWFRYWMFRALQSFPMRATGDLGCSQHHRAGPVNFDAVPATMREMAGDAGTVMVDSITCGAEANAFLQKMVDWFNTPELADAQY